LREPARQRGKPHLSPRDPPSRCALRRAGPRTQCEPLPPNSLPSPC